MAITITITIKILTIFQSVFCFRVIFLSDKFQMKKVFIRFKMASDAKDGGQKSRKQNLKIGIHFDIKSFLCFGSKVTRTHDLSN
jgi:hypothetical protein